VDVGAIQADLERAAVRALQNEWRALNADQFAALMRPPVLALAERERTIGRWIAAHRTIELDRKLVFEQRWTVVREVLLHEMAHQFVDEVLGKREQTAHGPAFQQVCAERRIDPRAAGLPLDARADDGQSKVIERVAKLLALAASASEHEAHTAMNAAQRLMLEHNISSVSERRARSFISKELGEPTGRIEEARSHISCVLTKHFFVEIVIISVWNAKEGRPERVFEVTGTSENVAMAEYVYAFLDRTADSLWQAHKRANGVRSDRDRRAFRAGVITGFEGKLSQERAGNAARGLVWVGDPELREHYRRRHPRLVTRTSGGYGDRDARESGKAAGRNVVISRPVEGESASRGLRLGDGRK